MCIADDNIVNTSHNMNFAKHIFKTYISGI